VGGGGGRWQGAGGNREDCSRRPRCLGSRRNPALTSTTSPTGRPGLNQPPHPTHHWRQRRGGLAGRARRGCPAGPGPGRTPSPGGGAGGIPHGSPSLHLPCPPATLLPAAPVVPAHRVRVRGSGQGSSGCHGAPTEWQGPPATTAVTRLAAGGFHAAASGKVQACVCTEKRRARAWGGGEGFASDIHTCVQWWGGSLWVGASIGSRVGGLV
jgi:hypothetical protein